MSRYRKIGSPKKQFVQRKQVEQKPIIPKQILEELENGEFASMDPTSTGPIFHFSFETVGAILKRLDEKFCFTRFGDGELLIMGGWGGKKTNHYASLELRNELTESFQVDDENYLIGNSANPSNERFVEKGLFKRFNTFEHLKRISSLRAKTNVFYSFMSLHYLFVFFPEMFKGFIQSLQRKSIGIVGSRVPKRSRDFLGIKEYVKIPDYQAYYSIDKWYPKVREMKSDLVLFCAGISSNPAQKRLWDETNKSSIDIGSIIDGLNFALVPDYKSTIDRTWIRMSLNTLRRNYKWTTKKKKLSQ